jgi:hypothetical protein
VTSTGAIDQKVLKDGQYQGMDFLVWSLNEQIWTDSGKKRLCVRARARNCCGLRFFRVKTGYKKGAIPAKIQMWTDSSTPLISWFPQNPLLDQLFDQKTRKCGHFLRPIGRLSRDIRQIECMTAILCLRCPELERTHVARNPGHERLTGLQIE